MRNLTLCLIAFAAAFSATAFAFNSLVAADRAIEYRGAPVSADTAELDLPTEFLSTFEIDEPL